VLTTEAQRAQRGMGSVRYMALLACDSCCGEPLPYGRGSDQRCAGSMIRPTLNNLVTQAWPCHPGAARFGLSRRSRSGLGSTRPGLAPDRATQTWRNSDQRLCRLDEAAYVDSWARKRGHATHRPDVIVEESYDDGD